jgi:sucrose phosphorylase
MKLLLKIKISQPLILKMESFKADILQVVEQKRSYLGQMDECSIAFSLGFLRRDTKKTTQLWMQHSSLRCFCYLHKQVGESNFFNKPGTWEYLERIKQIAKERFDTFA